MSQTLDLILELAVDGSPVTCTLSPESVQVILFALDAVSVPQKWQGDMFDVVSDVDWDEIQTLLANVTQEMLP